MIVRVGWGGHRCFKPMAYPNIPLYVRLVWKIGERLCDKLGAGADREEVVTAREVFCEGSR